MVKMFLHHSTQVSSADGQNVIKLVPVTVVVGERPVVSIRCVANCPSNSNHVISDITAVIQLLADCINCASDERLHYLWTVDVVNATLNNPGVTPTPGQDRQFAVDVRTLNRSSEIHVVHLTGLSTESYNCFFRSVRPFISK